ncbi:MAG: NAD-dependent epimerase/dehydratase family protein [Myxococcales bacterium]|nr:NAD-dependent epimerase/dehydratase family protein [Myxococcales bacterium]MCB9648481.1 NAD-dependent epimerase/dehydratase family protein [Deltaproteobacteria bacterium]
MKYLVTGGGGFLGEHIVRALLDRGHEVRVLGRSRYPQLDDWNVPCLQGDVRDPEAAKRAVEGVDGVFHVAARVGYWGPYAEYEGINVGGTQAMLDAARAAGVKRFVYTSTPSVAIGPEGNLRGVDETTPYPERYLSSYGPTKAEAERRVLAANADGFQTGAIRPHFIFGPKDPQIAPRLVERSKAGRLAQVGDGTNMVDVCYIDNCVDAHLGLMDALVEDGARAAGQAYFLGNEAPVSLWGFSGQVLEGLGAPPVKRQISFRTAWNLGWALEGVFKLLPADREPPLTRMAAVILGTSHYFSHVKATRDFGYEPRVSTEEGLERLFAHERAKGSP